MQCSSIEYVNVNFNPRSREGSDELSLDIFDKMQISIHAPARGATEIYGRNVTR